MTWWLSKKQRHPLEAFRGWRVAARGGGAGLGHAACELTTIGFFRALWGSVGVNRPRLVVIAHLYQTCAFALSPT